MSSQGGERGEPTLILSAGELMAPRTRRGFVRTLLAGGTAVMLPAVFAACDEDGNGITDPGTVDPVTGVAFNLSTDVGIFRFVHALEQLEAAFYTAVVASPNFGTLFSAEERELLTDLRNVEIIHREFVRAVLGSQAVPDLSGSINTATLATILSSRANVLNTARALENTGVAALNGAGKYLQDPRNLLIAGKAVSVEARHAAALRDVFPPSGVAANTAFAGDDITDMNGRGLKLEPGMVVEKVAATNLLRAGTLATPVFTAGPTAMQGVPSADFFPTNP